MDVMRLWPGFSKALEGLGRRIGLRGRASAPGELATETALRDPEEQLRLVRRATGLGMYEIDWVGRRRYWSPELRELLRVPADFDINTDTDLLERIIPEEMHPRFRTKLQASLSPTSTGDYEDEHRVTRFDGTAGWILLRGKTFFAEGPHGRHPTRSIGLIVDITDRKRAEETNALHASTVLSSNDAIFSLDANQIIKTWNRGAERLYGYPAAEAINRPLSMLCPDSLRDEQAGLYEKAIAGEPVTLETIRRHKDGRLIPVGISGAPIFDAEHHVVGIAAVHRDMTERHRYEEHLAFTLRELSHRTKNMLAVVQGLTRMIARRSDSIEEFESRLRGCIQALAYSHDLLVQHDWEGATLDELVRVQLAPFGGLDTGRVAVEGPEIYLRPQAMQSLGLILHELATNATKHGALSGKAGAVRVDWSRQAGNGVELRWAETGGPAVAAPDRRGFGQVVFDRIGASLDGEVTSDFRPEGLVCSVRMAASNFLPGGMFAPTVAVRHA
jgi:PAS domain S-box-containing protein